MTPVLPSLTNLLGGLGLFLLGLGLMTETLRVLAGNRLRRVLLRFTRSPVSGALVGAISTAVLQSSSATTVATVGFVSAGLLSFQASLGIIFGANVGSTGLGWLVALLGIRFDVGPLMLPLVLAGAAMRLLGRGRVAQMGLVVAGFALLFVGIDMLQGSLAGQGLLLDPASFDASRPGPRLQLLLMGLLATVITQSSGAGVATLLAGLAAGAIRLDQACAVAIGMDVGTTVTALIAAIGGTLSARRTAAAHVGFNLFTAALAFNLLPPYLLMVRHFVPEEAAADLPFLLTTFHTSFSLLGVGLMLPFTHRFAAVIRRLVRSGAERPADVLEMSPPERTVAAIEPARAALRQTCLDLIDHLLDLLGAPADGGSSSTIPLGILQADLDRIELYLDQITITDLDPPGGHRLIQMLHALDHLQRLHERCEEEADRARTVERAGELSSERQALVEVLGRLKDPVEHERWDTAGELAGELARTIHKRVAPFRRDTLEAAAAGRMDADEATDLTEAIRWSRRVSRHLRQFCRHMGQGLEGMSPNAPSPSGSVSSS